LGCFLDLTVPGRKVTCAAMEMFCPKERLKIPNMFIPGWDPSLRREDVACCARGTATLPAKASPTYLLPHG